MNKRRIFKAWLTKTICNLTERFAQAALYVKLPKELEIEKNVRYGDKREELLDCIYPSKDKGKQPLMIYIHGGGWLSGIKDMRRYYCYEWAKNGYFVANLDYTYAPSMQFPGQIQQLLNAIDYIIDNKGDFFDIDKVVFGGESAGGYFIAMLAAILNNEDLFNSLGLRFKNYNTFKPKALVSICGVIDLVNLKSTRFPNIGIMVESFVNYDCNYLIKHADEQEIKNMSPISFIDKKFPPSMIISAANDGLKVESYRFADILEEKNVKFKTYEGTGIISIHAWPIAVKLDKGKECFNASLEFVNHVLSEK